VAGLEEYNKETGISRGSQTGCPFCAGKKNALNETTLNVKCGSGKNQDVSKLANFTCLLKVVYELQLRCNVLRSTFYE
jgi:hypothetical protein